MTLAVYHKYLFLKIPIIAKLFFIENTLNPRGYFPLKITSCYQCSIIRFVSGAPFRLLNKHFTGGATFDIKC